MLLQREKQIPLSLRDRIALATQVTPELCSAVAEAVGVRARDAARVRRLVEAEAWTDAALALSDAALPHWKVTQLAFDDGEWFCHVAKHWQLPDWLDDLVETRHEIPALAILSALVEAYQMDDNPALSRNVPRGRARVTSMINAVPCDNFR
jgi:hypothetical protein